MASSQGREPIELRPLRMVELREALRMTEEAHYNDPVQRYLRDTPDAQTGWFRTEWTMNLAVRLAHHIRKGRVLTLGDVDGKVWYIHGDAADDGLDKATLGIVPAISPRLLSAIQKKRQDAFRKLFYDTLESSIGERRKEMIELGGLATRPSKQGRGYGSALMKAVSDIGDREGRAVWLGSSNVGNTRFYESHGFATVATVTLGGDDPTWDEPPIVLKLMVREPRATTSSPST